jgi:hypothetical protein
MWIGILMTATGLCRAQSSDGPVTLARNRCWILVAASDAIVEGRVMSREQGKDVVRATINVERWLKGAGPTGPLAISSRVPDSALNLDQAVIAFLTDVSGAGVYYVTEVADGNCQPITPYSSEFEAVVVEGMQHQNAAITKFTNLATDVRRTSLFKTVKRDIDGIVGGDETQKAKRFQRVLRHGRAAVPALVALLDDDRQLPVGLVDLPSPGSFEATMHYDPRTVFDLVNLALDQVTGVSFGTVDGGPRPSRERILKGWETYAVYSMTPQ